MTKKQKNQKGFSLVELVLFIALSGIIVGVVAQIMRTHLNSYAFIASRQSALADARYALNRMTYELLRVETADIITISSSEIQFIDEGGTNTSFTLGPSGSGQGIFRGAELLLFPVNSFQIKYYDSARAETAVIADIRKMELTVTTQALGSEGNITLSTMVTPRSFIYEGYQ